MNAHEDRTEADRVITAVGHMMARQLRALDPRAFGLINEILRLPTFVGSFTADGSADSGLPGTLTTVTLCYGIPEDPQSPYLEVLTDFTPGHRAKISLRSALGAAVVQERCRQSGQPERAGGRQRPPRGPLRGGQIDISVVGRRQAVRTQSYENFHGLQFNNSGLIATVIARGNWPHQPAFDLITDLEPYLTAMESPDSEVARAKLRALQAVNRPV